MSERELDWLIQRLEGIGAGFYPHTTEPIYFSSRTARRYVKLLRESQGVTETMRAAAVHLVEADSHLSNLTHGDAEYDHHANAAHSVVSKVLDALRSQDEGES